MIFSVFHRYLLVIFIFLMLTILSVYEEIRSYNLSYQLNKEEGILRKASEENKGLVLSVSRAELPQNVLAKAKAFGLSVKNFDNTMLAKLQITKPQQVIQLAKESERSRSRNNRTTRVSNVSHR